MNHTQEKNKMVKTKLHTTIKPKHPVGIPKIQDMYAFEPVYQDDTYAEACMYAEMPKGDCWKMTVSIDVRTGNIHESIRCGDTELEHFDKTTKEMPPEIRAQFDAAKGNAIRWLKTIRFAYVRKGCLRRGVRP